MLAEVLQPTQLPLPFLLGVDAIEQLLRVPPPPSSQVVRVLAHRRVRLPQLGFWAPPPRHHQPRRGPKVGGVALSLKAALATYRAHWKAERAALRSNVHPMLAAWGVASWDWAEDGRIVGEEAGADWSTWRLGLVDAAMARRADAVAAELRAKGYDPTRPRQVKQRTKQQAAFAATAALMVGKPGQKLKAKQAAKTLAGTAGATT
jgi:hypothetical protein